ncbi:penicillin-binding protein [Amphibacillus marinus]|uniref:serine-type D-Ala-D-Ala carboxypeptidase n=1 Tax=Amphibacillus marinus TaxID=872970 RepID=A0A1H8QWM9_9BACI|nr:penicillin-binding transpeptidase domain-containing protein [Amphibacillus marinus]SEO58699.1 penicillin-binding protein [Amphibacillus marinus]
MKKFLFSYFLMIVIVLAGCADEEVILPEDRLATYLTHWQAEEFPIMYDMLADQVKEEVATEAFIERYEKIYQDIEASNLVITFDVPMTDGEDEEPASVFPIQVSLDSIAGEISFTAEITMIEQLDEDEQSNWFVDWHPGLIFPELEAGGTLQVITTETVRGELFDRFGNGLALNDDVYEIGVDPGLFSNDRNNEIEQIADLLSLSVSAIESALEQGWVTEGVFVPLKTIPSTDQDLREALNAIPPVLQRTITGRAYPYSEAMAHLIGYVGNITAEELEEAEPGRYREHDQLGKRGLEQLFEARLRGERGIRIVAEHNNNRTGIAEIAPQPGEDIMLTIDANIQTALFESYQDEAGTAAAINPVTGETLALVSSPAFDPHLFTYGISQSEYDALIDDPDQPTLNRFASTYSPGSAFKPLTAAIGLNEGVITHDERIEINGLTWSKDGWGNYRVRRVSESSGPVDLHDALVRSDNIFFAQKALAIGNEAFVSQLERFGFGEEQLPYKYPIRSSRVANDSSIDRETLLADSGYGQGEVLMSALHLATTYSTLLNDGSMIQPILEDQEESGVFLAKDLISPEDAAYIRTALRDVVSATNGTARSANIDIVTLSGKTGTAELKQSLDDEDGAENGWFVAYPEEEDIIIAMMVENVQELGGSGYTVNQLRDVFQQLYE